MTTISPGLNAPSEKDSLTKLSDDVSFPSCPDSATIVLISRLLKLVVLK